MKNINPSLIGLLFGCPMGQEGEYCFFKELRMMPIEERLHYVKSLSAEEQDALVSNHRLCLCLQEMGSIESNTSKFDKMYSKAV